MAIHDITIEQGATFSRQVVLTQPSGVDVTSGSLVVGSIYFQNGYISIMNGDDFYADGSVFEAQATTYIPKGGGTVELMVPVNLTSYTVRGKIKDYFQGNLLATFTCSILDAVNGKIIFSLPAGTTETLVPWKKAYYDIEITAPDTTVTRVLQGKALFSQEISTL